MFVTVTHHGHRSGVYTCIFLHGSVGYFLVPGSCRIRKYIGITRSNASRFQEFAQDTFRFFVTCHYFIRTSRNTLCHIRSPFYKKFHLQHSPVARRPCFGKTSPLFCQVELEYPARFVLQIIKIGLILQTGLRPFVQSEIGVQRRVRNFFRTSMTVDSSQFSRISEITFERQVTYQNATDCIFAVGTPFHGHFTSGKQVGIDTGGVCFHITVERTGRHLHFPGWQIHLVHVAKVECPFIKRVSVRCRIKGSFGKRKLRGSGSKRRNVQAERHYLARPYRITGSIHFHIRIKSEYKVIRPHSVFISPVHQVGVDKLYGFRSRFSIFSAGFFALRIFCVIVAASGQRTYRRNSEQPDT